MNTEQLEALYAEKIEEAAKSTLLAMLVRKEIDGGVVIPPIKMGFNKLEINSNLLKAECERRPAVKTVTTGKVTEVRDIADAVIAGGIVRVKNGTYHDAGQIYIYDNSKTDSVILIPESPGGVKFTGKVGFFMARRNVYMGGFVFEDTNGVGNVSGTRETIRWASRGGHLIGNKFTRCGIGKPAGEECIWCDEWSSDSHIAGNIFDDTHGNCIKVDYKGATGLKIHHNWAKAHPWNIKNNTNGCEFLSFGTFGGQIQNAIIELNLIEAGGDVEAISIKSSGNTIRLNHVTGDGSYNNAISCSSGNDNLFLGNFAHDVGNGILSQGHRNKWHFNGINANHTAIRLVDEQALKSQNLTQLGSMNSEFRRNIITGRHKNFIFSTSNDLPYSATASAKHRPNGNVITENYRGAGSGQYGRYEANGNGGGYSESQFIAANTVNDNPRPPVVDLVKPIEGIEMPFWWSVVDASEDSVIVNWVTL